MGEIAGEWFPYFLPSGVQFPFNSSAKEPQCAAKDSEVPDESCPQSGPPPPSGKLKLLSQAADWQEVPTLVHLLTPTTLCLLFPGLEEE